MSFLKRLILGIFITLVAGFVVAFPFVRSYIVAEQVTYFKSYLNLESDKVVGDVREDNLYFEVKLNYNKEETDIKHFLVKMNRSEEIISTEHIKLEDSYFSSTFKIEIPAYNVGEVEYYLFGYLDAKTNEVKEFSNRADHKITVTTDNYLSLEEISINTNNQFNYEDETFEVKIIFYNPRRFQIESVQYYLNSKYYESNDFEQHDESNYSTIKISVTNEYSSDVNFKLFQFKHYDEKSKKYFFYEFSKEITAKIKINHTLDNVIFDDNQIYENNKINFTLSLKEKNQNSLKYIMTKINGEDIGLEPYSKEKTSDGCNYNFVVTNIKLGENKFLINKMSFENENIPYECNKEFIINTVNRLKESDFTLISKKNTLNKDQSPFYLSFNESIRDINFKNVKVLVDNQELIISNFTKSSKELYLDFGNNLYLSTFEGDSYIKEIQLISIDYIYNHKELTYTPKDVVSSKCKFIIPYYSITNLNIKEGKWFINDESKKITVQITVEQNSSNKINQFKYKINNQTESTVTPLFRSTTVDGSYIITYYFEIDKGQTEINELELLEYSYVNSKEKETVSASLKSSASKNENGNLFVNWYHYSDSFSMDYSITDNLGNNLDATEYILENSKFNLNEIKPLNGSDDIKYKVNGYYINGQYYDVSTNSFEFLSKEEFNLINSNITFYYEDSSVTTDVYLENGFRITKNQIILWDDLKLTEDDIQWSDFSNVDSTKNINLITKELPEGIYISEISFKRKNTENFNVINNIFLISDSLINTTIDLKEIKVIINKKEYSIQLSNISFKLKPNLSISFDGKSYYKGSGDTYDDNYAQYVFDANFSSLYNQIISIEFENGEIRSPYSEYDSTFLEQTILIEELEGKIIFKIYHWYETSFNERGDPIKVNLKDGSTINL